MLYSNVNEERGSKIHGLIYKLDRSQVKGAISQIRGDSERRILMRSSPVVEGMLSQEA